MNKTFSVIHGDLLLENKFGFVVVRDWYSGLVFKAPKNQAWIYRQTGKTPICRLENAVLAVA